MFVRWTELLQMSTATTFCAESEISITVRRLILFSCGSEEKRLSLQ
jgi:hypothetical protein